MRPFSALIEKQHFESISCNEEVTEILYQDRRSFVWQLGKLILMTSIEFIVFSAVLISGHSLVYEWEHKKLRRLLKCSRCSGLETKLTISHVRLQKCIHMQSLVVLCN